MPLPTRFPTRLAVLALALAAPLARVQAQGVNGYYRFPAIHGNTVVFTAEGDLWRVPVTGGLAQRLTTHPAEETRARLSPDGQTVAFSAAYEGPTEVYTMPLSGGLPRRITWDGTSARAAGWLGNGTVLYATSRYATLPNVQMHAVSLGSGARTPIPVAQASEGVFGEDSTFYFTRFDFQGSHTKRYRGGTAQALWRFAPADSEAVALAPGFVGTSRAPMLFGGRIYFASDRTTASIAENVEGGEEREELGVVNIWSSDLRGGDLRQHTFHDDYDVQSPSIDAGRIVYQQGADIWVLDLTAPSPAPRKLEIRLTTDNDQLRERWITNPQQYLTSFHVSPSGDRVVLVSRGNVFVAPVGQGRFVHATPQQRDHWIRYREARFLPDGKSLLALSDESGEVELWKVPANGIGARAQLTKGATVLRWDGLPSPDGKWIAHHDKDQRLWLLEVATGKDTVIAENPRLSAWISSAPGFGDMQWSPDGRWLAYGDVAANMFGRIALYDVQRRTTTHVTTDRYDSWSPAFTPDGAWLYFLSERNLVSVVGSPWGMRSPDPYVESPTKLYAVQLRKGAKWPFAPKTELDPAPAADSAAAKSQGGGVSIDLEGIESRLFEVPVPAGNYQDLSTDGTRLYWRAFATRTPTTRWDLRTLELKAEAKPETWGEDVAWYELTADRKKLLFRRGQELYVVAAAAKAPATLTDARVDLSGWTFAVDPRAEFAQMYEDAWRLERDYFYDRNMHGVDWPAMREKYRPLVERVTDRAELADLLAQLVGELSALHIYVSGGDFRPAPDNVLPASLGAVLEQAEDGWRVARLYRSDPDIPEEVGPLLRPGVNITEGDVLLAINGTRLTSVAHPSELLRNQAGRQVLLRVRAASGGAERDVIVTPIAQSRDADLRYDEWEYTRRQLVDSLSQGRVGYLHIRNMGTAGMTEFMREYYPQFNRQALVIDVRNNTGGNIDAWLLARLLRQAWFQWQPRVGEPYHNMPYAFRGPMVVLVNERTASDGEAFAEGFRRLGLGKVIGTRTWGGEVWLSSSNVLLDRGIATAAEQGVYDYEGTQLIEGWGVEPDIVIDNLPAATFTGRDVQLERAIEEVLKR